MKQSQKTVLLWVSLILMFVFVYRVFTDTGTKEEEKNVRDLQALISAPDAAKTIEKVVVEPRGNETAKYVVHFKSGGPKTVVFCPYGGGSELTKLLDLNELNWGVEIKEKSTFWESLIISWRPMIFLVFIFFFVMKQLQGGGGKAILQN